MYENFLKAQKEKQEEVLKAAYKEFGIYGYRKTSIEQIAKSAGVSKGMIFHYFSNKVMLFEYLVEEGNRTMIWYFEKIDDKVLKTDFIERLRNATKLKMDLYIRYPYILEFYTMLYMHPENLKVSDKVAMQYQELMDFREEKMKIIYQSDSDAVKAKKYIQYIIDGFSREVIEVVKSKPLAEINLEPYWTEFDEILDDMKSFLYLAKEGSRVDE
ncbi:TetR/AcrR family transcriptional regulator [Aequitasia blattaphilus]|uniref:TetR/AcrR family transcriptional regulator n=1 Tax=Aequitasia blattaphilus TaxID=2949332 RepID=A0ABT1ED36_9FIRM|nr:TetR/AcrR family transcriptional regulator [Aequitasia blattaphilus]MCP1102872.1 TetR/AcrR family transcriptional regulator [Aequitasia blattaphilus]MCR8615512.1 TetR/AcrR family transcriptional regulator [Aequitasia blattaphilus]